MMSINGGFARTQLAILLVVTLPACMRDLATEPDTSTALLRIEAVSPTELKGTVGETVNPVPTVVVRNETGRLVSGAKVAFIPTQWSDSSAADSLTNRIVITDSNGIASAGDWKLGTVAGSHGLEARLVDEHYFRSDSGRAIAFHAEAEAAAAAALSIGSSIGDTVGLPGDELYTPVFRVIDRFRNNVAGVTITFSVIGGGGSLSKTRVETSRFGDAAPGRWTLGPKPGQNSMVASSPGLDSVTYTARALDVGAVTWYDLVPRSVRLLSSGALALCEDGTFEMVTVETSDAFPGEWPSRQHGTYTLTGTVIVLTFPTGVAEQGTLVDHRLSFVHKNPNWVNYPLENWIFVKRGESTAATGVPPSISGVMTPQYQVVRIAQGGAAVLDAEVRVNAFAFRIAVASLLGRTS
jgi:hypothetical protein